MNSLFLKSSSLHLRKWSEHLGGVSYYSLILGVMTLSKMGLVKTLSIGIQHNSIECHYAECRYADFRDYLNVILSGVMLNVFRLGVVRLSVVAP